MLKRISVVDDPGRPVSRVQFSPPSVECKTVDPLPEIQMSVVLRPHTPYRSLEVPLVTLVQVAPWLVERRMVPPRPVTTTSDPLPQTAGSSTLTLLVCCTQWAASTV